MVNTGLNRAFGASLQRFISHSTSNRFKGFFAGMSVAAVLQSATAATLIVSSFAARGIVTVRSAIAVVLGADVGSTLAAQLLTFDLKWMVPVLLASGYIVNKTMESSQYKHAGRAMIGVALIMVSLKMIVGVAEPLEHSMALQEILLPLGREPALAILLSALLTWMAHSSLGMVLFYVSFVATGTIPLHLGLLLILGANIGSAIAPIVMTLRDIPLGRRVPLGNLLMRSIGVAAIVPFLEEAQALVETLGTDPVRVMVNFHTAFNLLVAAMFLPFIGLLTRLSEKILPDRPLDMAEDVPRYLDVVALETPQAALSCAARETLRISDVVQHMLRDTLEAFKSNNMKLVNSTLERDNVVDALYEAVKNYLVKLSAHALDKKESNRYMQIWMFSTNLEHIGDIIEKSLLEIAAKKIKLQQNFSKEGFAEITDFHRQVMENIQMAQNIFMSEDVKMAKKLYEDKAGLRQQELSASQKHFDRLRAGVAETIATSNLHLDILRDLRRINSYVTAVAYPILEEAGELKGSRLKSPTVSDESGKTGNGAATTRKKRSPRKPKTT